MLVSWRKAWGIFPPTRDIMLHVVISSIAAPYKLIRNTYMSLGRTIRIYLDDGSVSVIRHAEIVNWTGQGN